MIVNLADFELALGDVCSSSAFVVGLSGGLDSVVLLHALKCLHDEGKLAGELRAIHVNHGLQDAADEWQAYCETLCKSWNIKLSTCKVLEESTPLSGIENAARDARYSAFDNQLNADELLLLAHHQDDQVETVLFRLMRGAGARGLAGIPAARALGSARLARPLLPYARAELLRYAQLNKLEWREDASNQDQRFDRNYLRHTVVPALLTRWPDAGANIVKSALLLGEADELLSELAASDLEQFAGRAESELKLQGFFDLSSARQRNVLRHWLSGLGIPDVGWNLLHQLEMQVLQDEEDGSGGLIGPGYELRRFQETLYALRSNASAVESGEYNWQPQQQEQLVLPGNGCLTALPQEDGGLRRADGLQLRVCYRRGGESIKLSGRPTKALKKLFQEQQVSPWLRERIPLLFAGEELVAVPGLGVAEAFAAPSGEAGLRLNWAAPELAYSIADPSSNSK